MRCVITQGPTLYELVRSLTVFSGNIAMPNAQKRRHLTQFVLRGCDENTEYCTEAVVITALENDPSSTDDGCEWLIKGRFWTLGVVFFGVYSTKTGAGHLETVQL